MDISTIKELLHTHGIAPLKSRGQNFLINDGALEKIAALANYEKGDICVEVGSGLGALTEKLAANAKRVIAVEIDAEFARILQERYKNNSKVNIIHEDIARFSLGNIKKYNLVGNLPYNISGDILEKFLQKETIKPEMIIITVQKEFAEKLTSKPPHMTKLGLFAQYYGAPRVVATFPPSYFWPQPSIYSSLVEIKVKKEQELPLDKKQETALWNMAKVAFIQSRKMLKNSLNINHSIFQEKRPQALSLDDWIRLVKNI